MISTQHMGARLSISSGTMAGLRVLIVEDSAVQRAHAVSLAEELGAAQILEAADGLEGLALLAREARIDLVLSDLEMPNMDGIAFIGELAARGFRPRVIIVSSQESEVLRSVRLMAETYGLHVPGVIPKPLTLDSLAQVLSAVSPEAVELLVPPIRCEPSLDEIRRGIAADEFICFFQPQITLQGALLRGVEALVRWRHPELGLLGPAAFLPQAEADEGVMFDLTMAILARVAEHWHGWRCRGLSLEVAVNISARSISSQDFADRLIAAADGLKLPPKTLVFELTESASVSNLGHTLANLARLRMRGFKLSIDDFSTGFATFEQLERFPFMELKLDRSIVKHLPGSGRHLILARNLLNLAQDLNLTTVAEGIETLENWRTLRDLGCGSGQGYFIARPMPGEQVAEWAQRDRSRLRAWDLA